MINIPGMNRELARHIMGFVTGEGMDAIEVTEQDMGVWVVPRSGTMNLAEPIAVSLTGNQWAAILAIIRVGTSLSSSPGIGRLAHDDMLRQIQEAMPNLFDPKDI